MYWSKQGLGQGRISYTLQKVTQEEMEVLHSALEWAVKSELEAGDPKLLRRVRSEVKNMLFPWRCRCSDCGAYPGQFHDFRCEHYGDVMKEPEDGDERRESQP
jgi:hypothetical protein